MFPFVCSYKLPEHKSWDWPPQGESPPPHDITSPPTVFGTSVTNSGISDSSPSHATEHVVTAQKRCTDSDVHQETKRKRHYPGESVCVQNSYYPRL